MKRLFLIACVALFIFSTAIPARAAVKVGGIIFSGIMWDYRDEDRMGKAIFNALAAATGLPIALPNLESNTEVHILTSIVSRLYARWTNEDNVGLYIELGLGGTPGPFNFAGAAGGEAVLLRHLYGWYHVSPSFRLKFGKTTSVFAPLNSSDLIATVSTDGTGRFPLINQNFPTLTRLNFHGVLQGYGNIYGARTPQIRGEWDFGPHYLGVALADWRNSIRTPAFTPAPGTVVAEDTVIPRLDVGARIQGGPVAFYPGFTWQRRSFEGVAPGGDDDIEVYALSLGAKTGFGPVSVTAEFNYGENWKNAGILDGGAISFAALNSQAVLDPTPGVVNRVLDTTSWGSFIDVGIELGIATLQLRYGIMKVENDDNPNPQFQYEFTAQSYGASLPINVAKGFIIRPEIMFSDEGDDPAPLITGLPPGVSVNWGRQIQYAVQFQVIF
jgi:hypothetical protein